MNEIKLSETKVAPPMLADDWVTIYRLHRERVTEEDAVINHRMTWMLYSQTILFIMWGGLFAA
jgi:hypothetical protein